MALRSMTAYAQARAPLDGGGAVVVVSLKSVNHRYLDLQLRMPAEMDALEIRLRKLLKEKLARGHVELTLALEQAGASGVQINKDVVSGYVNAFRQAASAFSIAAEPDLNAILKMPGALGGAVQVDESLEKQAVAATEQAIEKLNAMRAEEGRGMGFELKRRMAQLSHATEEIGQLREAVSRLYFEKVQARMAEMIAGKADQDRVLQEAAMLAERSDIQEEIVRMKTHIQHFLGLLEQDGEVGKKLDFLMQEMNREANTLMSKTAGVSGDGLRITELGLLMKSEIEKSREQVQNIE
jgi:uncharacterized protein (TIGR00255 family)